MRASLSQADVVQFLVHKKKSVSTAAIDAMWSELEATSPPWEWSGVPLPWSSAWYWALALAPLSHSCLSPRRNAS